MALQTIIRIEDVIGRILARPKAPPIVLKKFRAPVTTARSFLCDVACAATKATNKQIDTQGRTGLKCQTNSKSFNDEISYDLAKGDVWSERGL
jgi:hypothetical protein